MLRVVVFPLPFGPKMPYTEPGSTEIVRLLTAVMEPYFLVRFVMDKTETKSECFFYQSRYGTKETVWYYKKLCVLVPLREIQWLKILKMSAPATANLLTGKTTGLKTSPISLRHKQSPYFCEYSVQYFFKKL